MANRIGRQSTLGRTSRVAGLLVAIIGVAGLVGWAVDVGVLKSGVPGFVEMKANTAACFVMAGLALWIIPRRSPPGVDDALSIAVVAVGLVSVAEYVTGLDAGIDELLFRDPRSVAIGHPPGRMALASALTFVLMGAANLLSTRPGRSIPAQGLVLSALLIPLFSSLAYLFGERAITMASPYTSVAITTAFAFFGLGAGVLCRCPEEGPMAVLVADDPGGASVRRLLPVSVGVTLLLGSLSFTGARSGLYGDAAAMALFGVANSVVLAAAIWTNSWSLSRTDAEHRRDREWFRLTLASIGDAVIAADGGGRVQFMNRAAEGLTGWAFGDAEGRPLPEVFRIVDETTRAPAPDPVARALAADHVVGLPRPTLLIARDGAERPIDDGAAPIKDARGGVSGVVVVFRDVAEKRRAGEALRASEERHRFLDRLGEATRDEVDPLGIMATTARLLGEHLGATRIDYADVEADGDRFAIRQDWTAPGASSSVGTYSLDLFGPRASATLRGGHHLAIRDVDAEVGPGPGGGAEMFRSLEIAAAICFPLVKGGRLAAMMAVNQATPRDWSAAEIALVGEVVERSWAHIERARDAAALREKDERLKLLVENVRDYAVVITDAVGSVIEWEGGAERITGHAAAEALGRTLHLIYTPEDRAGGRPEAEIRLAAEAGRAEDRRWHLRKDGSRFFAEGVTIALHVDGKLRGFGKVFKDATGEKHAEEAREHRAGQLQKLAEIATRINSARDVDSVIGVVTEEARGLIGARQAATSMVPDARHPQPLNAISTPGGRPPRPAPAAEPGRRFAAIAHAEDRPIRLAQRDLADDPRWRELGEAALAIPTANGWLAAPLIGRDGRSMGLLQLADKDEGEFTGEDEAILVQLSRLAAIAITNARSYEELRGNDRRKDEFLAMLAHELRNPLAAITNAVRLASGPGLPADQVAWSMDVIARQMRHLTRLIDDLLDVSRISRGKIELRRGVIDASPILDGAAATVEALVRERGHRLEMAIDRGNLWVDADPTRLEQVVVNLLSNAAKYSEDSGRILLTARNEGGEVMIRVEDEGVGIAPENVPRMFELFAQGDRSLARSEGGLGIGLTVVKRLVEMHGGTIAAGSEGPGKGSRFTIRLPAADPVAPRPEPPMPSTGPRRGARILVVDDHVDTARGMARLLGRLGHEVATAHDGPEGIEAARDHRPEFVLLDIGLPGMSGYEVAAALRLEECCRGVVIIAISGYGQEQDRRRSKEAGFDHHLIKPLDHDALLALLALGPDGRA